MRTPITSRDAASRLGCSVATVSRVSRRLKIGSMVGPVRVFTDDDLATLAKHVRKAPGNPNFGKHD